MHTKSNFWNFSLVFSLAALGGITTLAASCGHPGTSGQPAPCSGGAGSELCPCEAGNVCQSGLVCATDKNQCVSLTATGGTTGSAGTSGNSGSAGTTGSTGSAGTTGSSGIAGTTGATGIAGTTGAAGTTGSTGAAGTTGSGSGNLIINGDFSMGMTDWKISSGTPSNSGVNNGQFCVTLSSSAGTVVLGWGDTSTFAAVNQNINYIMSYQASTTGALSMFQLHIGSVQPNYAVDQEWDTDVPGSSLTTITHNFMIGTADPQAGIAFLIAAATGTPTVCVDNVSLTASN
ncbi:MAG TPA: hypothetical protein VFG23_17825 [Polyangia bacterium]|nr:hypothetical protein [Polyangia bacterium]